MTYQVKTIEEITKTLERTVETVSPGNPASLTEAHSVGDGAWQGDLGLEIVDSVPADYTLIENPKDEDRQLVPLDGGPGSHHRLASFDGVTLYRPKDWGKSETDLRGPCVVFGKPNSIVHEPGHSHPHGTVTVEAPMTILCRYQRNLAADEREARRAAD